MCSGKAGKASQAVKACFAARKRGVGRRCKAVCGRGMQRVVRRQVRCAWREKGR